MRLEKKTSVKLKDKQFSGQQWASAYLYYIWEHWLFIKTNGHTIILEMKTFS